ncbi:mannose-1-phosphate guanylyltransferase/mannose-6-phosphate isomerase [Rhizobium sp. LjRoot98]|uniref:mannose-1-phosphate guanylyltransferase/mannose-6-phosphate isomerase n=1 Tax=unclassified Rhizobium TaxID=2613769 RepID=UPI000715F51A|nr:MULTISPECIES: mannose-1-phosphate guanylyltransferase/mannose-6-phosphate isomerase [unclassified Rhizobium]KQV39584.1 mannose-1-phosphate guanyltransferase [Rhizobium sp. Root1204]KQY02079.1 mannose-1-phosphate guanyltransferase [Rhizobium sp. Root1334]KRB95985.1 mannose-1-phosphate guanyltransferase [Rhizobium sp. Root73]
MSSKIVPVIMAGGRGTRLWPLSRSAAPKQFLQFLGDHSLFQKTLKRVADTDWYEQPVIVTNSEFRFIVAEQAMTVDVPLSSILLEPVARNTAPALAAAAFVIQRDYGDDAVMQVLASDHEIDASTHYFDCIFSANETAKSGKLVTFGIKPTEPATGYGYIEIGADLDTGARTVARFVEKPDQARAEELLASGRYLWNSGMFMLPVALFLSEMAAFAPDAHAAAQKAVLNSVSDLDFVRLETESFSQAPDISVDYAVFEKTAHAAVVPSAFSWSDLGSWDSVWAIGDKDEFGNVVGQKATVSNTRNSLVLSRDIHIAVNGLDDMAVIASEDAVYVGHLADSQNVGQIVKLLAKTPKTRGLTQVHPTSYKPWGAVASVLSGERFEVKRLHVAPGRKISLQKHHHRSEHWIVVCGTAEITIGDQTRLLHENESIYIPQGEVHRLSNPGKIPLELIEVQTGSYLKDDDIVRLDDEFGRA